MAGVSEGSEPSISDVFKLLLEQRKILAGIQSEITKTNLNIEHQQKRLSSAETKIAGNAEAIAGIEEESKLMREDSKRALIQIEQIKQKQIKNSIEIRGIPLEANENVTDIVINLMKVIGLQASDKELCTCFRAGKTVRKMKNGESADPPIVAEFVRESLKMSLLGRLKSRQKTITTPDLGFLDCPINTVYVNERLTPYMKQIFFEGRRAKKAGLLKYLWMKNSEILGRVDDESPIINFTRIEDFRAITDSLIGGENNAGESIEINGGSCVEKMETVLADSKLAAPPLTTNEKNNRKRKAGRSSESFEAQLHPLQKMRVTRAQNHFSSHPKK